MKVGERGALACRFAVIPAVVIKTVWLTQREAPVRYFVYPPPKPAEAGDALQALVRGARERPAGKTPRAGMRD